MSVYVSESSESVTSGLSKMKAAMIEDYKNFGGEMTDIRKRMCAEYAENFTITHGKKYIKIVRKGGGVMAFVVGVDNDKKFKKGDILKPAGWAAPARNAARGNILEGNYAINWTGPLYL
tara:strand:- start:421 stop:777 length:357 start_codon:yes stop_codon:yes gene_type:complete